MKNPLDIVDKFTSIIQRIGDFVRRKKPRNQKVEDARAILNTSINAIEEADQSVKNTEMSEDSANHCNVLIEEYAKGAQKEIKRSFEKLSVEN